VDGGAATRSPSGKTSTAEDDELLGQVIGDCRIEATLGRGAMGRVYRAHHVGLDRPMAFKVLEEKLVNRPGFVAKFLIEARSLAKLDHQNVVRVFNVGKHEETKHFIVMELLEGGSVDSLWRDRHKRKLPIDLAVRIVREAAEGLHYAHKMRLIHRDVKPANLMLTADERVKVVDFGIAIPTEGEFTVASEIAGTPHYMAPEQADGRPLDARVDQYALGVTLYQLLGGRTPFEGRKTFDILLAHVNEMPKPLRELRPDVPPWLERICARMMAKNPDERYPSLQDAAKALEAAEKAKEEAAPVPAAPPPTKIKLEEIVELEKGVAPKPVEPPSWKPAAIAIAASFVVAVAFFLGPVRAATIPPSLGSDPPVIVTRILGEVQKLESGGRPLDLVLALKLLRVEEEDLKGLAAADYLSDEGKRLEEKLESRRKEHEKTVKSRVQELLSKGRHAQAIDACDPEDPALNGLGLEKDVKELRDSLRSLRAEAVEKLASERGEIYVPGGPFPAHARGIATSVPGFYLDRTEMTNEDWVRAMNKDSGLRAPDTWAQGKLPEDRRHHPVTGVSFEDAERAARALGKRLPTHLEWQKAARGVGKGAEARLYPWSGELRPGWANLGVDGGQGSLAEVTKYKGDVSPFGVLGLAGNAQEWVRGDRGPLVAGGSFRSRLHEARVFAAFPLPASARHPEIGFRCARDVEAEEKEKE
jgi:hypothetical protein